MLVGLLPKPLYKVELPAYDWLLLCCKDAWLETKGNQYDWFGTCLINYSIDHRLWKCGERERRRAKPYRWVNVIPIPCLKPCSSPAAFSSSFVVVALSAQTQNNTVLNIVAPAWFTCGYLLHGSYTWSTRQSQWLLGNGSSQGLCCELPANQGLLSESFPTLNTKVSLTMSATYIVEIQFVCVCVCTCNLAAFLSECCYCACWLTGTAHYK